MGHLRRLTSGKHMFKHSRFNTPVLAFIISSFSVALGGTAFALSDGDLQRAILDARALGDVGASVKTDGTTAFVSTYLTPRDDIKTCKAKSVLVAKTLFERVKTLALVRCKFCTPADTSRYIFVSVGEGAVKAFASGSTTMPKLIASLPYEDTRLTSSGSAGSASGAARSGSSLGITLTGTVHLKERQVQISYMEALLSQGSDVREAVREFNLEQASIDAGDQNAYANHFSKCSMLIEALNSSANSQARAASQQDGSPVKPGSYQPERTALWNRLNELKRKGISNPENEQRFQIIEQFVGKTDPKNLENMIQSLYSKIR